MHALGYNVKTTGSFELKWLHLCQLSSKANTNILQMMGRIGNWNISQVKSISVKCRWQWYILFKMYTNDCVVAEAKLAGEDAHELA